MKIKDDALDINGEPHVMRSYACEIVDTYPMTMAGFDCQVAFNMSVEEFADLWGCDEDQVTLDGQGRPTIEADQKQDLEA